MKVKTVYLDLELGRQHIHVQEEVRSEVLWKRAFFSWWLVTHLSDSQLRFLVTICCKWRAEERKTKQLCSHGRQSELNIARAPELKAATRCGTVQLNKPQGSPSLSGGLKPGTVFVASVSELWGLSGLIGKAGDVSCSLRGLLPASWIWDH